MPFFQPNSLANYLTGHGFTIQNGKAVPGPNATNAAGGPVAPPAVPFNNTFAAQNAGDQENFKIQDTGPGGYQEQLGNLSFDYNDPTNPFNTQIMLQKAYEQRTRGNVNSFAARGHSFSGAYGRAQGEASFQNQRSQADALSVYNRARQRILGNRALGAQSLLNNAAIRTGQQADISAGGTNVY